MNRIYKGGHDGETTTIDLGRVAAIDAALSPALTDGTVELIVHFDGGGHLRMFRNAHPALEDRWINYVRSLEQSEVRLAGVDAESEIEEMEELAHGR